MGESYNEQYRARGCSGTGDIVMRVFRFLLRYTNTSKGGEETMRQLHGVRIADSLMKDTDSPDSSLKDLL